MKLGSIVGIVFSCLLIIAGIVLCVVGNETAKDSDQLLFTQRSDGGTYYCEKIDKGTNRVKIQFDKADITVIGGAEKSQIEFINFNPNLYSVSITPNIVSFEEIPSLKSIVDIGENGINFKGLRYLLDFKNYDFDDLDKSIVISLSDDTDLKSLDITGENSNITLKNIKLNGDISLKLNDGTISVDKLKTSSTLEIIGDNVNSEIKNFSASNLRFTSNRSKFTASDCSVKDVQVDVKSGSVTYATEDILSGALLNITSETGEMIINGQKLTDEVKLTPENYERSLSVITKEASVSIDYQEQLTEENLPEQ